MILTTICFTFYNDIFKIFLVVLCEISFALFLKLEGFSFHRRNIISNRSMFCKVLWPSQKKKKIRLELWVVYMYILWDFSWGRNITMFSVPSDRITKNDKITISVLCCLHDRCYYLYFQDKDDCACYSKIIRKWIFNF